MQRFIWVVGAPRSGTTLLTYFIGQATDKYYNEPWRSHPLGKVEKWKFPQKPIITFKYCANSMYYEQIQKKYPNSKWVHMIRSPEQAVYSMYLPKSKSRPRRRFKEFGDDPNKRFTNVLDKWYSITTAARAIENMTTVYYEKLDVDKLSKALELNLSQKKWDKEFKNMNIDTSELDSRWDQADEKHKLLRDEINEEIQRNTL
tara:strand:- start:176 stop:781 length:606 start_codon:yes stop_codon:yes gene_type:complete